MVESGGLADPQWFPASKTTKAGPAALRFTSGYGLSRGPVQGPATQEMHVEVEDGLSGTGAYVEDGAVSTFNFALAGDLGGSEVAASDDFGVGSLGFFQAGKMPFWNDERVSGRLRIDVLKGKNVFVFVDLFGRNFSANDATEEAVGVGVLGHLRTIAWESG
jgi:hypothetical protein